MSVKDSSTPCEEERRKAMRSMEVSSKGSAEPRRSYREIAIQETGETSEKIEPPIGIDPTNRDAVENSRYLPRRDHVTSKSTSLGHDVREEILDGRTEMILLQQEPARDRRETTANRRIIELSDNDCKLALRRHLEMADDERGRLKSRADDATVTATATASREILRKLPPDTIVIRQRARSSREGSSDYRELTESSSSGGSSSTSGCATAKKKIPRAVRNKTRETVEVRRNPMRLSKKKLDKNFPRPRQRLLADCKTENCLNYESGKRKRGHTMPYMNTRSVTRRMYTVGATYQAPNKKDYNEWKEWPVHGMHERPVYHPRVGLAAEYLGKYFISLDGLSYKEMVDEPEIEVVAVDPHDNQRSSSGKKGGKAKAKSKRSSNVNDRRYSYPLMKNGSFEMCMHGSFHCVLGYCSQVMALPRKRAVEQAPVASTILQIPNITTKSTLVSTKENANFKDNTMSLLEKLTEENKLPKGCIAQSIQNKSTMNDDAKVVTSSTVPSTHLSEAQKPKTLKTTSPGDVTKLLTPRDFSITPLALLKDSDTRTNQTVCDIKQLQKLSGETLDSIYNKLQTALEPAINRKESSTRGSSHTLTHYTAQHNAITVLSLLKDSDTRTNQAVCDIKQLGKLSDEAMNSMFYNKLRTALEPAINRKKSSTRGSSHTLTHYTAQTKKNILASQNAKVGQAMKENDEGDNENDAKIKQSNSGISTTSSIKILPEGTSATSEIARILSEYNRSATKKSAMQSHGSISKNMETTFKLHDDSSSKNLMKTMILGKRDISTEENQNILTVRTVGSDPSYARPKKFRILEGIRAIQSANNQNASSSSSRESSENRQMFPKDRLMNVSTLNYVKEKPATVVYTSKQSEIVTDDKAKEMKKSECSKDETEISKTKASLQELLENTAVLYCAANGVHQDDLSSYIDTLDGKQSIQWLTDLDKPE